MAGLSVRVGALWLPSNPPGSGFAVVVSVTRADGSAVTGLTVDDFDVYVVGNPNNMMTGAKSDFAEFPAPPGGVYMMGTGNAPANQLWDPVVVALAHVKSGADEGRGTCQVAYD
jgi:hypothetical protein